MFTAIELIRIKQRQIFIRFVFESTRVPVRQGYLHYGSKLSILTDLAKVQVQRFKTRFLQGLSFQRYRNYLDVKCICNNDLINETL